MKWIGLTGSIGSGKSTVSRFLKTQHIPVIDADEIAKKVVEAGSPGLKAVLTEFGSDLLLADGSLNRLKLGQHVFSNPAKKLILENILHPLIRTETLLQRKILEDRKEPYAIYDIPLLFETNSASQFDAIILVSCTKEQQKERLRLRNPNWSDEDIEQRINSQIPMHIKEQQADFIVHNDRDMERLKAEINNLLIWLKEFSKKD
ncbi:MAG: dephospho-CoA kinase [Bdellovibrio sp.]